MRKTFVLVVTAIMVLGLSISTHSALIDLGGGMIYSTDLNLTWLQCKLCLDFRSFRGWFHDMG